MGQIETPRTKAIGRRLRKAMDDILAEARAEGIRNPALFFESEGYVYVMDADSEDHTGSHNKTCEERQRAIRIHVCTSPPGSDVGAW